MTDAEFTARLAAMRDTLYRVSYSQLRCPPDRDDAVQETLLRAWHNRHKLRDERYMQTWVIRILINECHNIQRRQKREAAEPVPEQGYVPDSTTELRDALLALEERLRLPVVLHYIEGYRVREIATMLGVPRGSVLWRLSKAREALRSLLDLEETAVSACEPETET